MCVSGTQFIPPAIPCLNLEFKLGQSSRAMRMLSVSIATVKESESIPSLRHPTRLTDPN